jgi:hypothetical protein
MTRLFCARLGARIPLTLETPFRTNFNVTRAAGVLLALLAGCSSAPPDPRITAPAKTPPLAIETEARGLVDSLSDEQVSLWADSVSDLEPALRAAVHRELARRAVAVREKDPPDQPEPAHKETQAIRLLLNRNTKDAADFVDFLVWSSAHKGPEGEQSIRSLGIRAFPSLLKLRRDHHPEVSQRIAVLLSQRVAGGRKSRVTSDEQITAFCREELTRCPEDDRPHYRAILAALGEAEGLDAFPTLLRSEVLVDQIVAHLLLYGMMSKGTPYSEATMKALVATTGKRPELWQSMNELVLDWWQRNHDRLSFDPATGYWNVE